MSGFLSPAFKLVDDVHLLSSYMYVSTCTCLVFGLESPVFAPGLSLWLLHFVSYDIIIKSWFSVCIIVPTEVDLYTN